MSSVVIGLCRYTEKILSCLHKGSSLPGKLALKYNSGMLGELSSKYKVILVTGTNGKTTTASLIAKILKDSGHTVIHNFSGANMLSGVMTLFIKHEKDKSKEFAVVEIDEASVPLYAEVAKAEYILCTNIFKDQLDRYGEMYTTFSKLRSGIKKIPGITIVSNGDEPLFGKIEGKTVYFGLEENPYYKVKEEKTNVEGQFCIRCGERYSYEFNTYNHLGKYMCKRCGYKRPLISYYVKDISIKEGGSVRFKINDQVIIRSNLVEVYNIYNILAAYAITNEIGIKSDIIVKSVESFEPRFGRSEVFEYSDKKINIVLVKNPVGFNQGLRIPTFNNQSKCACFLLNDNGADGRDVSWIWDVDFESNFIDCKKILVGGKRKYDMALRLKIAGYESEKIEIFDNNKSLFEKIKSCSKCSYVYIYATYTAMIELRRLLAEQKIIDHSW